MPPRTDPQLSQAHAAATRGDLSAAASLYRQILQRRPRCAEAHHALGDLIARAGQAQNAIQHLERAAELEPANAAYQFALAKALSAIRMLDKALEAFNKARWLDPSNTHAHVDAATILELQGKSDEALKAVRRALSQDPEYPRAQVIAMRLEFRADPPQHDTLADWSATLRNIADKPDSHITRTIALDLLIDVKERLEDYDAAWNTIIETNDTDRQASARSLPPPERRDAYTGMIDNIAAFMTPQRAKQWRTDRPDDTLPDPALLVGFPRSGTTMTELALDAHPRVRSIEERPTFELTRMQLQRILPRDLLTSTPFPDLIDHLTVDHVAELRRTYWSLAGKELGHEQPPTDAVVLDKMPLRIADLPFVNRIFPDAKVLVALRDPRDACLSSFRQRFAYAGNLQMSFMLDLHDVARLYKHVMGSWLATRDAYTLAAMEIRYEDTVSDFEPRIRKMLDFLDLEFDDAVLSFHQRTDRLPNTPSYHTVHQPVSSRAVGRWKNYESHLAHILPTLQPFIEAFGYTD